MTTDREHHQLIDGIQVTDQGKACQDNATITTIGTPSTREIEELHETIDPLEIDQKTATVALQATIVQGPEVNHHINLTAHRQTTDDQQLIQ